MQIIFFPGHDVFGRFECSPRACCTRAERQTFSCRHVQISRLGEIRKTVNRLTVSCSKSKTNTVHRYKQIAGTTSFKRLSSFMFWANEETSAKCISSDAGGSGWANIVSMLIQVCSAVLNERIDNGADKKDAH